MSEERLAVEPLALEPSALSTIPPRPPAAEGDFEAIYATVRQSARGRWFLDEYARRNRNADTNLVLAAIERIETVVRDSRDREAYHSVRGDLLEMARTIAVTRAEVAESKPEARTESKPASERRASEGSDVFATAERIQDVAWTMRERGFDPRTCDQIETLARSILSASALRDPNDHRTGKLGEVLHYLERRIDGMLESWAEGAQGYAQSAATVEDAPLQGEPTHGEPAHAGNGHDAAGHAAFAADAGADDTVVEESLNPRTTADIEPEEAPSALQEQIAVVETMPEPDVPAILSEPQHESDASAPPTPERAALEIEPLVVAPLPAPQQIDGDATPVELTHDPIAVAPTPADDIVEPTAKIVNHSSALAGYAASPEEAAPPKPVAATPIAAAASEPAPATADGVSARPLPNDPLAALRALSDEERIALFT
jgi:hypothetical protein